MSNYTISKSQNYDPSPDREIDKFPENLRRMYVYKIPGHADSKGFFIPGGTTLLRLTIDEEEFDNLKVDKEDSSVGTHKYTEVLPNETLNAYLSNQESASWIGNDLEYERQFTVKVWDFFDHEKEDRFLVTFDEPFDTNEFITKNQEAFIIAEGQISDSDYLQFSDNAISNDSNTLLTLTSLHSIEDNTSYTKIVPYISSTEILEGEDGLDIKLNEGTLLERVTGYSKPGDNFVPLDFRVVSFEGELTPMKVYPTSINNHLTCYFDWLDADLIMPENLARNFLFGGERLDVILPEVEDFQLVSDMILFTSGFQEQFRQVARNDDGKFEPKKTIGYSRTPLSALVGQSPIEIISALVDTYLKSNPSKKGTVSFQRITQLIVALSRYIISTYSIAKGNNSFNEFYLPWYLDAKTSFDIVEENDNLQIKPESLTFELKSNWFDLSRNNFDELSDINITSPRIKQLQNKFQMPWLPVQIQTGDLGKSFNPGGIDPSNPKELNYILYNIGKGDGNTRGKIASLLNTEKITIKKGTVYKVSDGNISSPAFPVGVIPKPLIDSLAGTIPQRVKQHIMDYTKILTVGYFGKEEPYNSEYRFVEDYIKPRIMNQLGITDSSAIDISIPNQNLPSSYNTISTEDKTVDNTPDVRGIVYANMLDNSLIQLGNASIYNLNKLEKSTLKNNSEEIFRDKDWQTISEVDNDEVGKFISKYISEPVSLEGSQGVVRYKELQPKEIIVTFKKDIDINTNTKDKVLYNKSNWNRKVKTSQGVLEANLWVEIDKDHASSNENISQLKLLEISGLFMEELSIVNTTSMFLTNLKLEAPSNTDETITVFRIAFI